MSDAFSREYSKLNIEQKQAVDAIDGPVLVIAGPGTGKTQLLSMRVANILQKTDTDAQNILCLTFTNKAATNMKERLLTLTDGAANHVMVKTFHSFAAELMNMYPDSFWNGAKLTTAPDTVQIEVIRNILQSLPLDNPLAIKFAGTFTAGNDVKQALKLVKEAGLTPEKLESIIKANLAYIDTIETQLVEILTPALRYSELEHIQQQVSDLPKQRITAALAPLKSLDIVIEESLAQAISDDTGTNKTKATGKWKQRFIQTANGTKAMIKERERNEWWLALSEVYRHYRDELHKRGYYDYSDMLVEVISVLEQNPTIRADAQEKFLYVMIDEFQDTNAAQLRLAHLIADHPVHSGKPNIMAVGDDDQSIYKFNGAELNNMLTFKETYPTTKLIVLHQNYRSSQAVLNAAEKIIEHAEDRLTKRVEGIHKNLQAINQPNEKGEFVHLSYPTLEYELSMVARRIQKEHASGNHSIAVLARGHDSLRKLSGILLSLGVPVAYQEQSNILDHQLVQQVYIISALLVSVQKGDQPQVNELLSKTLRHPMWQLDTRSLWNMAKVNHGQRSWLDYMLDSEDERLVQLAQWLLWLSSEAAREPLPVVIEHIVGLRTERFATSPMQEYFVGKKTISTDYVHALSALRKLLNLVDECARLNQATLEEFVEFIKLSMETNEIIADESYFVSGDNAVELLTVHKAKGLEFDTVYIVDAVDTIWSPSHTGRKPPANLPLQPPFDDNDDYARLMYVAATRAKRSIIANSYRYDEKDKETLASPLIQQALPLREITKEETLDPVQVLEEHLQWPKLTISEEKRILQSTLDSFTLSATALLDFLDVTRGGPRYFMERHLLCLPQASTPQMAFGTAIHSALELAQIQTNDTGLVISDVVRRYERVLRDQYLPTHEYKRYLKHGKDLLADLLKSGAFWLNKGSLPEQKITGVKVNKATIGGTIDRLDVKENQCTIVDYKTGKPLPSFNTKAQNAVTKAWRHKNQLLFYVLLLQNSGRVGKNTAIKTQMIYVEAAHPKELVRELLPTQEEKERLAAIIDEVWNKIMSFDLPNIDHYSADHSGIAQFENDLLNKSTK